MRRDRLHYLVIPAAALMAILPLILSGPSCGHDFDFHVLSWLEAASQFRHGNLHPHWAFSPAWNAGEPRFVFYPPISWTLGAVLGLLLPWIWTPAAYTWIALTASGLAMHRLARAHAGPAAALLASTLYLANPYMLFTAYERTAYAELLAAAWFPLLFHAILKPRPTIPAVAIPLALLWLTNAPAAVMGTYTLALLTVVRLAQELRVVARLRTTRPWHRTRPARLALTTAAGTLFGFALAAFYILPAAAERPLVQISMVVLPGMRIDDNTLFHHTGLSEDALAHDAVLHTASILAVLFLTAIILSLTSTLRQQPLPTQDERTLTVEPSATQLDPTLPLSSSRTSLALLTLVIAFLLTPASLPIWHHAPELAFLQFPWRLLAVLATILGLAVALALKPLTLSPLLRALVALASTTALAALAAPTFRQPCDVEDTVQARTAVFQAHLGSEPTDEYTPAPADNDSLQQSDPPYWLSTDPDAPPPAGSHPGSAPLDLTLDSAKPQFLILNLRRFPAWHVTLNGTDLPAADLDATPRADGLTELPLPAGRSHISLAYRASRLEQGADCLSSIAALTLVGVVSFRRTAGATT